MYNKFLLRSFSNLVPYLFACLSTLMVVAIHWFILQDNSTIRYQIFLCSIALSAWYGGVTPGLLATALGFLAANYLIFPPLHGISMFAPDVRERAAVFIPTGILISLVCGTLRATKHRLEEERRQLQQNKARLASELEAMKSLYDYVLKLMAAPDLTATLNEVLDTSITITRADYGYIQTLNAEGTGLEINAQRGFNQAFLDHFRLVPVKDPTSVCGSAAEKGGRLMVSDVEIDPVFEEHRAIAQSVPFRAVQSTALRGRKGLLLGMLSTHFRQARLPTEEQLRMLDLYLLQAINLIERMHAEESLLEADRRKDEFLATLAHELRNPLAPISNALAIIESAKDKAVRDEAREIIGRQVEQMVHLVDDLMDASRITQNKIVLRKAPAQLADVIAAAVEIARPLIKEHGHTLDIRLPSEPVWLNGDRTRLAQIFSNLLTNAAKYTDSAHGRIELSAWREGKEVAVAVRDNGIGIAPAVLPRVFTIFAQVDSSLERAQGGLGIGLSLVKNLAALHGGSVEAYSEGTGKGCEFTVRLPMMEAPPQPIVAPEAAKTVRHCHWRILVVEDNIPSAKTLGWLLEAMGHEVQLVHDSASAVETAKSFVPDVALLDLGLPNMNGYDLCRVLRCDPALRHTVFIAQTGWGQEAHKQRSKEAGFDYHLVKPVDIRHMEALLDSLAMAA
jgi:signal transduction histidine kinase/ActR/RegA family two-component response regulator